MLPRFGGGNDICDLEILGTVQGAVVTPETPLGEGSWNSVSTEQTTVSGAQSFRGVVVAEFVRVAPRPASCWQFKSSPRLDKRLSGADFLSAFNFRQFTKTMF